MESIAGKGVDSFIDAIPVGFDCRVSCFAFQPSYHGTPRWFGWATHFGWNGHAIDQLLKSLDGFPAILIQGPVLLGLDNHKASLGDALISHIQQAFLDGFRQ